MTSALVKLSLASGETRSAAVVREISAQIVAGKLPPGRKLDEATLGEWFGLSRTPIREALRELAAIGLVESLPHRGACVARVRPEEMMENFEFMSELECLCAGFAARRMSGAEKAALKEIHDQGLALARRLDRDAYRAHNTRFHAAIYDGARNASLREATLSVRRSISAFRAAQFDGELRMGNSQSEHGLIVAAIQKGDAEDAKNLMREHLRIVMEATHSYLREKRVIPI